MIWILARNVWMEQLRNRFFHLIWIFGGLLAYASVLVGVMAVEQEVRVLLDLGLAMLELLCLGAAVFVAANSILRELELKTIYLILARPVPRGSYLLGRYFGLLLSVFTAAAAMAGLHLSLLLWRGWEWTPLYLAWVGGSLCKVVVISALTVFLSLLSTSVFSALTMTGILWTLGHFAEELRFLTRSVHTPAGYALKAAAPLLPDLQLFNLRDAWSAQSALSWSAPAYALGYMVLYSGACLCLAYALFRRKEF